jgi:hypothetical protein
MGRAGTAEPVPALGLPPQNHPFLENSVTLVRTVAICSIPLLALAAGCTNRPTAEAAATADAAPSTAAVPADMKDVVKPMKSGASGQPVAGTIEGTVAETMNAASYTYVRLATADRGDVWAAASQFPVTVGDHLVVSVDMPMRDFHSDSLDRDFPLIYFASSVSRAIEATPSAAGQAAMPPGHPPTGASKAAIAPPAERIAPPSGGTSIADVWANKQALSGKSVTVRGKVMKFNGGIMGRNWVHLQDGTGSDKDGTHDLTVTTDADVKVGDVVTLRGTLAIDKDFTAGYKYPVILESAQLVK